MLSRLALKSAFAPKPTAAVGLVRSTQTSAPLNNAEGERDLVNYPRPKRPIDAPPVRMGFIPDNWFRFFYNKTGVTGPYMFGTGVITFLVSKEFYVMDHEFVNALTIVPIFILLTKKFGPQLAASLDKQVDEIESSWDAVRDGGIKKCEDDIQMEKATQDRAEASLMLFDAKKENVAVQLETEYRQRLVQAHEAVKKKLDYQLEVTNVHTRVEQKHMVDWIVNSVRSSITPAQEASALKKCFADLKVLAKA